VGRRLTPSQRALRQLLRHARPFRRGELIELDARWLAEAIRAAEPQPARIVFRRGVDGARALEAVRGVPLAGECFRAAGITEATTPLELRVLTLARFCAAVEWLREQGVDVVALINGPGVAFACDSPPGAGVPLVEELELG
jgi:hypothetical protein